MSEFFDRLETRSADQREAEQMVALTRQVAHAQAGSAAFGEILRGVDALGVRIADWLDRAEAEGLSRRCES